MLKYSNTRYGVNITNIIDTENKKNKMLSRIFTHYPPCNPNPTFTKSIISILNHKNILF